jgi:hypothetical protein
MLFLGSRLPDARKALCMPLNLGLTRPECAPPARGGWGTEDRLHSVLSEENFFQGHGFGNPFRLSVDSFSSSHTLPLMSSRSATSPHPIASRLPPRHVSSSAFYLEWWPDSMRNVPCGRSAFSSLSPSCSGSRRPFSSPHHTRIDERHCNQRHGM